VALLADGARPERIVALTFTRKAAGEFFDEILNKLANAAGDPGEARKLAEGIECPGLGAADFLRMLRAIVESMHRLRLGTLDSFFAAIVRAFPLELGLTGEFEILQEHAARIERQRVLRRMFVARALPMRRRSGTSSRNSNARPSASRKSDWGPASTSFWTSTRRYSLPHRRPNFGETPPNLAARQPLA